ncbi:SMI1/KNR4 family protein [Halalkalibacter alkalisediminis]|uniref:SMI1/KNR4 family protein n=1 Tax=Halalkalibacter alkalisediminis TaxID=935616 RepID=A0ABV6NJC6_9BACI|nr:SMI1/KNR4 family protein [Halalkalibacter alkalisediminis]
MKKIFWLENHGHDFYKLPQISETNIKKAIDLLGVKLPDEYINLIKEQNGGRTYLNSYPVNFPNVWSDNHIRLDFMYGIGTNEGILDNETLKTEWGLPSEFILLSGDGHTWIAFDYENGNEPKIVYYDVDEGRKRVIANSFAEFVSNLYHLDENLIQEDLYLDIPDITFTKEEGEKILNVGEDIEVIANALIYFQNNHKDPNWFLNKLNILLNHVDNNIVYNVAESLMVLVDREFRQLDQQLLSKTMNEIENHKHPDGKIYAEAIRDFVSSS